LRSILLPRREEDLLRRRRQEAGVPALRRSALALRIAGVVEETIEAVVPAYFEVLAEAVTRSFLALAHKRLVERIQIARDGEVVLLDRTGSSVQDLDASAGERHIFAMALVAAVADLAGCAMPVVMDTPLGRLDSEHRNRILRYFSAGKNQTILLAQPDEIHGRYLAQIEPRVAVSYHLDHEVGIDGPGESVVNEGYFPVTTV
jgi:DNA sulfur modification protein DndD